MPTAGLDLLPAAYNHVVLPPDLPGNLDSNLFEVNLNLVLRFQEACTEIASSTGVKFQQELNLLCKSLNFCRQIHASPYLDRSQLEGAFRDLNDGGSLIIHVAEQNAGLLVRRCNSNLGQHVLFEAFEVSPKSADVLKSQNTLQWDFPTSAATVPVEVFTNSAFQASLADYLARASSESIKRFSAVTIKAKSSVPEQRDTADPALITSLLITVLEGIGEPVCSQPTRKRVRDEVRWQNSKIPWRRSPFWLLLRVGIHRHLSELACPAVAKAVYKFLMCIIHAGLLDQAVGRLSVHASYLLLVKVCRRLAKLEKNKSLAAEGSEALEAYDILLEKLRPRFQQSTQNAINQIQLEWNNHRAVLQRWIPQFETRHARATSTRLNLRNSEPYFAQISLPLVRRSPDRGYVMPPESLSFTQQYFRLDEVESQISAQTDTASSADPPDQTVFSHLAQKIHKYLQDSANRYEIGTEDRSKMILSAMSLWVVLDKWLMKLLPEFQNFLPVFPPNILDCLLLSQHEDLNRLQDIQVYLKGRLTSAEAVQSHRTVFDNPTAGCFAESYYNSLSDDSELHELDKRLQEISAAEKDAKEKEWRDLDSRHEQLTREISATVCEYRLVGELLIPEHNAKRCQKCRLIGQIEGIRMRRIEKPLPNHYGEAKAVLLELLCPPVFADYRDATWSIITALALPDAHPTPQEPRTIVQDYYSRMHAGPVLTRPMLTLGSKTKSFLQTHYNFLYFPVSIHDICVNNGLKFEYYDRKSKLWPAQHLQSITFNHHCAILIPRGSPFAKIEYPPRVILRRSDQTHREGSSHFNYTQQAAISLVPNARITSNEILAGQHRCPNNLRVQESIAFRGLMCGEHLFWPTILIELGSSNLNFNAQAVMMLNQALLRRTGNEHVSNYHSSNAIFAEDSFCGQLCHQIERRLESISSNWRENFCMEILITIILKLLTLGTKIASKKALALLELARETTIRWLHSLRKEFCETTDAASSGQQTQFILWSALLCRRTYAIYDCGESSSNFPEFGDNYFINDHALSLFIEASISMHEHLPTNPAELLPLIRSVLVRDLKMVCRLRKSLRRSLERSPRCLILAAVQTDIMNESATSSPCTTVCTEERDDGLWIKLELGAELDETSHTISFHVTAGVLLVDGHTSQKEILSALRDSKYLLQLFPHHRLAVYPSTLPGMTYKLAFNIEGHEIHLGFRQSNLVIRAWHKGTLLEFIPGDIFRADSSFDLPASMVENCVHWLNLRENVIEVRKAPKIWKPVASNWIIDLTSRTAWRNQGSTLVDPYSGLFRKFTKIFLGFELPYHITVFQPPSGAVSVELRRFELSFFVNRNGLLECRQLQAELDPHQDAGTWYGLLSSIVLRDVQNPTKRSIIVPLGPPKVRCNGMHVEVKTMTADPAAYGRFFLDDVLGRVTCAAEPRLLYTKALLHAYTSFCLPDPLTMKTGTEESCRILQSGACQPYAPLTEGSQLLLDSIADLPPSRQFYPSGLRVLETTTWSDCLTTTIQDDRLGNLVASIKEKSDMLSEFQYDAQARTASGDRTDVTHNMTRNKTDKHLSQRSHIRRQRYQRIPMGVHTSHYLSDLLYVPRGYTSHEAFQNRVFQAARLIHEWPTNLPSPLALHSMLETWQHIGGYQGIYDKVRLSDQLETDIASSWGQLANLYRQSAQETRYTLIFLSAALCFGETANIHAIHTLIAFAVLADLKTIRLPLWPSYVQFRPGFRPNAEYFKTLLRSCGITFEADGINDCFTQRKRKAFYIAIKAHESQVAKDTEALVDFICSQWPCAQPSLENFSSPVLDLEKARSLFAGEWHAIFQNYEFEQHLREVQGVLDRYRTAHPLRVVKTGERRPELLKLSEFTLLCNNLLNKPDFVGPTQRYGGRLMAGGLSNKIYGYTAPDHVNELFEILNEMPKSKSLVRNKYIQGLRDSTSALMNCGAEERYETRQIDASELGGFIKIAKIKLQNHFQLLVDRLIKEEPGAMWIQKAGLWPLPAMVSFLETIRSTSQIHVADSVRRSILELGLLTTDLQRLLRLQDAQLRWKQQTIQDELSNPGHTNWDPSIFPDWLLLEIDANILIRPIQADVASATIKPASASNSVLQLNMGQGKTSIIIPLVVSVLANGKSLCRVIVPKALLLQTAQLLQSRLGGLLDRELRHLPFSRRTPTTCGKIQTYMKAHRDILEGSGIAIALPEHLMSFMLSGQQRISDGRLEEASQMTEVQKWLSETSRDVLDESDFTMATRTQLIYPSGPQITVDGGRHRWETIQAILRLVQSHLHNLQHLYYSSIQVVSHEQREFPFIYFLRTDVQEALMQSLVSDICNGWTSVLKIENFSFPQRQAIKSFISERHPDKNVAAYVSSLHKSDPASGNIIYLLRGLIVYRILILALSRRWNVQYGLHPQRDPVAVPFHAKGVPSEMAEWGHPDVALLFTCLSFYYQGLSLDQLTQCLTNILESDDPAREYEQWIQDNTAISYRHRDWTSINLEDESQVTEIWQSIRYSVTAVNYFLNRFVFPKHAKQFKVKLQTSGWDLPLSGQGANLTTGFSGTNDNRLLLPLTIKQDDLAGLAHTNAAVLTYLLHQRNRGYALAGRKEISENGQAVFRRLTEEELLSKLHHMGIRILIDSGASVLEMTNVALVRKWLEIDYQAAAAVYFDDANRAMVISRAGHRIPLLASSYADDLSNCLVYLDECHTRGTDMKFPPKAHGAVTLSLGQTKDQTVQAVMRLRQLATSQSVTFFAPPEVHRSILDLSRFKDGDRIDSHHVVRWLLEQTSQGLENLQPLYYAQGINYCRRIQANHDHAGFLTNVDQRHAYLNALQDPEQQSLVSLYGIRSKNSRKSDQLHSSSQTSEYIQELEKRRKAFQDTGNAFHASALQEVEQEREVAVEAETIREQQRPVYFHPYTFAGLHEDLREFVRTSHLKRSTTACEQAYVYMRHTNTGQKYSIDLPFNSNLLVSSEFTRTVHLPSGKPNDEFLRPVQWILWSTPTETAILVTPEEAEILIGLCRHAPHQTVHLLAYAAPVTKQMLHFHDLDYFAVPALPPNWSAPIWLKVQLGIVAGRLYFPFSEFGHIRSFLGLNRDHLSLEQRVNNFEATPGKISGSSDHDRCTLDQDMEPTEAVKANQGGEERSRLAINTLNFLHDWLTIRGKNLDFTHTPMGYVCSGKLLTENHAFFRRTTQATGREARVTGRVRTEQQEWTKGDDDASDFGDEIDERQKLTEEELRRLQSKEEDDSKESHYLPGQESSDDSSSNGP